MRIVPQTAGASYDQRVQIAIDCRKAEDFGIGRYIRGLTRGLASIPGAERYLLLAPVRLAASLPSGPRFELLDIDAPHYSIRELLTIGRAVDRSGAALFHSPHYVLPFTSLPAVVTIHDLIHLRQLRGLRHLPERTYARWMMQRGTSRARGVMTVSASVAATIEAAFPVARGKITVTPNGVDDIFFAGTPLEDALPQGLEKGSYFLYVGNDKPHKNLDRLVAAFRAVRRQPGTSRLALVGAPVSRFAAEDGVVSIGKVDDARLACLYRGAIALILPSLDEGFGLPAAEAMASGTAVIVSAIAPLIELTGDAALQVDPFDVTDIGRAMLSLERDGELRQLLVARGLERAASLRWGECAARTLEVYRSAAIR